MHHRSRGRAVGGELVSYRRRSVDAFAKPDAARDRAISTYHAADCDCPQCVADRANERDDTPPDAA